MDRFKVYDKDGNRVPQYEGPNFLMVDAWYRAYTVNVGVMDNRKSFKRLLGSHTCESLGWKHHGKWLYEYDILRMERTGDEFLLVADRYNTMGTSIVVWVRFQGGWSRMGIADAVILEMDDLVYDGNLFDSDHRELYNTLGKPANRILEERIDEEAQDIR